MDNDAAAQLLDELISSLKALETQSAAVLQFLKDQNKVTDEQLAPYLEQTADASDIKWRASRLRLQHLLTGALNAIEQSAKAAASPEKEKDSTSQAAESASAEVHQAAKPDTTDKAKSQPQNGSQPEAGSKEKPDQNSKRSEPQQTQSEPEQPKPQKDAA